MLHARAGLKGWPRRVIQSKIAPFKLFVSSDLALAAPFCIYTYFQGRFQWESVLVDVQVQPHVQLLLQILPSSNLQGLALIGGSCYRSDALWW